MIRPAFPDKWSPPLLSVLRIIAGLLYLEHGTAKLLHYPYAKFLELNGPLLSLSGIAGCMDLLGGSLLALGLYTRPVAFLLSGEMAVAYFLVKYPNGFFPILNGGELNALYSFLFLYFAAAGGGPWSIDRAFPRFTLHKSTVGK
ncbi:MAG TPA: DoxX family protein [Steroidobacteraceae bacterium]